LQEASKTQNPTNLLLAIGWAIRWQQVAQLVIQINQGSWIKPPLLGLTQI
jgi:hypothetical protein